MNILIKLTCLIGLVIAPILGGHSTEDVTAMHDVKNEIKKEVKVELTSNDAETAKAVVTTSTTENGETVTDYEVIEGSIEEVKAKVESLEGVDAKVEAKTIVEEVEQTN
jgi:K(+)-stimulated pyrophosphate-energized sodium pump